MALASLVQELVLLAFPAGGQASARRNAWASMSACSATSRARREAETALELAVQRTERRQGTGC